MCLFKKEFEEKEIGCYFSRIDYLVGIIPLDEQGFCVFHSENETWKNEHNFNRYLKELINYFEEETTQKNIFLEDIIFTSSIENLFDNKEFKKDINFNHSQFKGNLIIKSSIFKNLNFNSTIFNELVSFTGLSIKSIMFDDAYFKSKLSINSSDFHNDFFMLNTHFDAGISILKSTFHSNSFFQNMRTNMDKSIRCGIVFKHIHFKKFTTFETTEFNSLVDFKQITVHEQLFFHKTQFNYDEPLPIVSSVTFEQIIVKENGKLEFRGTSDNKMFNKVQNVSFIKEEIKGTLFFEHTDLTKFPLLTKERFIKETKMEDAKVIIGIGCEKYYNRTPLKSIKMGNENQNLVVELCNIFVDYFTKNGGFNLGVEFVNKIDKKVNFFYFSDEVISYKEFENRLQKSEQSMWRLIKIENDNLTPQPQRNNLPSKIVNATDTIVNLMSLILKIGSRFPFGLISKEEISHLVNSTLPSNTKINDGIIVNQIVLFGIKNTQSFQVKKLN